MTQQPRTPSTEADLTAAEMFLLNRVTPPARPEVPGSVENIESWRRSVIPLILALRADLSARIAKALPLHYVTAIECDHEAATDTVRCNCSVWTGAPQPSVGAAVQQWVDHVLAAIRSAAPVEP